MKTLLQINVDSNANSTGVIASQIGELAIRKGWKSYIAYSRTCRKSKNENIKIGNKLSYSIHWWMSRFLDCQGLLSFFSTLKLLRKISKIQPSIIHLHVIHDYFLNYPLLLCYIKKHNIPVVWTFHDCWSFTGHCAHFDYIKCKKWMFKCSNCPQLRTYSPSLIDCSQRNYKLKKRYFTGLNKLTIVPVSQWLAGIVKASFLGSYNIHPIYNGVDVNRFCIRETYIKETGDLASTKVLIAVASSWSARKGLKDYIELSSLLDSRNFRIVLIGQIDEKNKKNIPDRILTIPRTKNQDELVDWYNAADIVLNLSYEETFGLTTIEGMACGTPSIVYDRTASPELVTPETGVIVNAGNIEAVADAIKLITNNGKDHYKNACRMRALEYFNKEDRYEEYIQLYEQIINNK